MIDDIQIDDSQLERIGKILNEHENDVNAQNYDDFYDKWVAPSDASTLTYVLQKSKIDYLKSMTRIWENMFNGLKKEELVLPKNIKVIDKKGFYGCPELKKVVYEGSITDWSNIQIAKNGNDDLFASTIYYYAKPDGKTIEKGHYWFYNGDKVVSWHID